MFKSHCLMDAKNIFPLIIIQRKEQKEQQNMAVVFASNKSSVS